VRRNFCDRYGLTNYKPFKKLPRRLFTGGLAQTAALLNSMIAGAVTALGLLSAMSAAWVAVFAGLVFVLSLAAQFRYIRYRHQRA